MLNFSNYSKEVISLINANRPITNVIENNVKESSFIVKSLIFPLIKAVIRSSLTKWSEIKYITIKKIKVCAANIENSIAIKSDRSTSWTGWVH